MEPKTEIWKRAESSEYGFDACNKCPAETEDAILAETGCGVYETCVPPANVSCNWTTSPHWKVCKSTMSCISKAQSEKTRCPYTRKKGVILETDTDTQRSGHVAMETGVSDAAAGAQEAGGWTPAPRPSAEAFRGSPAQPTPGLWTWGLQDWERKGASCSKRPGCGRLLWKPRETQPMLQHFIPHFTLGGATERGRSCFPRSCSSTCSSEMFRHVPNDARLESSPSWPRTSGTPSKPMAAGQSYCHA